MSSHSHIFVIIPSYNEATVIRSTVADVLDAGYRVVVVDDASQDDTRQRLTGMPVYYLRHEANLGQGAAIRTGIEFALRTGAEYLVTFDADGQHDVADIAGMIALLANEKADIVFGSRFLKGAKGNVHRSRKLILRTARLVNFLVSGMLLSDANNGLRAMTAKAARLIPITETRSSHNAQVQGLVRQQRLAYRESPVNVSYTDYSRKKGLRNVNSIRILYDLILYKIFR